MGETFYANGIRRDIRIYSPRSRPSTDQWKYKVYGASKKASHSAKSWWNDPDTKRKKRIVKYKLYTVEGKVKASVKKGFRWIKKTCSRLVHGF